MKQTLTPSSQLPLDHLSELNGSRSNAAFDYLENVPNIAATVCNKEGIVLYQNKRAIARDGNVVGKNLYNCHSPKSGEKIRMMMETGMNQGLVRGKNRERCANPCRWSHPPFRCCNYRSDSHLSPCALIKSFYTYLAFKE